MRLAPIAAAAVVGGDHLDVGAAGAQRQRLGGRAGPGGGAQPPSVRVVDGSDAVGFRHTTRAPRRTGAASRFTGLQTPPSTYSRSPIADRREQPRHRARGEHRVGHLRRRRARLAEHHALAAAAVDGRDAQAPVEARAEALEVGAQASSVRSGFGAGQHGGARDGARGPGRGERQRRQRRRGDGAEARRLAAHGRQGGGDPPALLLVGVGRGA